MLLSSQDISLLLIPQVTSKMALDQSIMPEMYKHQVEVNEKPFIGCFSTLTMNNRTDQRPMKSCYSAAARYLSKGDTLRLASGYVDADFPRYARLDPTITFWGIIKMSPDFTNHHQDKTSG